MSIEIRGEKFQTDIISGRILLLHRRHILDSFNEHGNDVVKELKRVTSTGSRTGRVYMVRGVAHRASAEGEPPAKLSGRLSSSFVYKARMQELVIGNTAFSKRGFPYPGYLEPGYFGRTLNRPFFAVTIRKLQPRLESELGGFLG